MKPFVWIVIVLLFVGAAVWSALFTVDETQYAIVTRFGAPYAVIEKPGLRVKWPYPVDSVVYFDKRLLVSDIPRPGEPPKEFLTLDKKNIEVASYACWRIVNPRQFLESVGGRIEAEAILGDIIISELGAVLGNKELSDLISIEPERMQLPEIAEKVERTCGERALKSYGVEIVDFGIKRLNFPEQNRKSVFDRMRAERKRMATRYRSEGEKEATTIRAEADKESTRILAEAYRQAQEIEGKADAEAARIYAAAYGQDPEFYEFLRTLESYEKSLTQGTTILLPADSPYLKWLRPDAAGGALSPGEVRAVEAASPDKPPASQATGQEGVHGSGH